MHPIRLLTFVLLLGSVTNCALYAQPPEYGSPRGLQPGYDYSPTPQVDVGFFYDELSPYGDWVLTRSYGWAWFPRNVHPYWRPYVDGRWVNTEYGWTWVSYEPFGWATYHYGRWTLDPRFGWLWVPGTDWGPAWVSWQYGGEYVGWAPLPPAVGFEVGFGIRLGGFDLNVGIRPDAYNFVPVRSFLEPHLSGHRISTARNVTIIHNTTNITNYGYVDNRVVNRGVEVRRIEQVTGRAVRRLRLAEARSEKRSEATESEVRIYRAEREKLDTVRVRPHANAGRAETPSTDRDHDRPAAERRDAPEVVVAPRAVRTPKPDARELEKQELHQKQELERYQREEERKLERLHDREAAEARAQAERNEVEKRHQAEREALQQERRDAEQQLAARQEAQRRAVLTNPSDGETGKGEKKDADRQKKEKEKKEKEKKEKGKGKDKPDKKDDGGACQEE